MKRAIKPMPLEANANMIDAAYMLLETMPTGTPERDKRLVAAVWRQMAEVSPKPRSGGLTTLQMITHEIIADYINDHGQSPTYEEIGQQLGKTKSEVFYVIHALKRRGAISVKGASRRSIRLLCQPGETPVKPVTKP